MNIKNCTGKVFYYGSFVLLPVVIYYLKYKYTTIEFMGRQLNSMVTIFPVYVILTMIIIFALNTKKDKEKCPNKSSRLSN